MKNWVNIWCEDPNQAGLQKRQWKIKTQQLPHRNFCKSEEIKSSFPNPLLHTDQPFITSAPSTAGTTKKTEVQEQEIVFAVKKETKKWTIEVGMLLRSAILPHISTRTPCFKKELTPCDAQKISQIFGTCNLFRKEMYRPEFLQTFNIVQLFCYILFNYIAIFFKYFAIYFYIM